MENGDFISNVRVEKEPMTVDERSGQAPSVIAGGSEHELLLELAGVDSEFS